MPSDFDDCLYPEVFGPVGFGLEDFNRLDEDSKPCRACGRLKALPIPSGRCHYCEPAELERGMPQRDRDEIRLHLKGALGEKGASDVGDRYLWFVAPDASYWDNREHPDWRPFRIQILCVDHPGPRALRCGWRLAPEELPPGRHGTRLRVDPAPDAPPQSPQENDLGDRRLAIVRVRLWQPKLPGYLQGRWLGEQQRIQWDLCDMGACTRAQRRIWDAALDEAKVPGATLVWENHEGRLFLDQLRKTLAALAKSESEPPKPPKFTVDKFTVDDVVPDLRAISVRTFYDYCARFGVSYGAEARQARREARSATSSR